MSVSQAGSRSATLVWFVRASTRRHFQTHAENIMLQMLEAAEGGLLEARRAAVAAAERAERLEAERDAALRQVAALQAALAGESAAIVISLGA